MTVSSVYYNKNIKRDRHTSIRYVMNVLTGILWLRRGCKVQCSSKEQSSTLPVYSTICVNIIHHHMVQSSLQILNATCCIQTVTFSFNTETSSVGCHRVMVLKANIAALSTCALCKDTGDADGINAFRDFCLLHTIRSCVNMFLHCVVYVRVCIKQ